MYIADTLSRAYLNDTHKGTEAIEESEYRIHPSNRVYASRRGEIEYVERTDRER